MKIPFTLNGQPAEVEIADDVLRRIVGHVGGGTGNNPLPIAAKKLGIGERTLSRWISRRRIAVVVLARNKKFITDAEIERFKTSWTRKAIA